MTRKVTLLVLFVLLLAADTAHFGGRCVAGILWLRGERALFDNNPKRAWRFDTEALWWGGNPDRIETDMAGLLVMGLDQLAGGFRPRLALPPEASVDRALFLIGRRISASPFNAYNWSQASDVYMHVAARRRRAETLDLSQLNENPIDNLLPEERLALVAQEIAANLEPNNYIYHDLLGLMYLDLGSPEMAAPYCRRSVTAAPDTRLHSYLLQPNLPPVILEAALQGFEDATRGPSMVSKVFALAEAARTLSWQGDDRRAVPFLKRAIAVDPEFDDAEMQLAEVSYRLHDYEEAILHASRVARMRPEAPGPHHIAGLSNIALGRLEPAIESFRKARELGPDNVQHFIELGQALESAGRVKEAERQLVAAANRHPTIADAWASLLSFYVRQHDREAALEVCSKLANLESGKQVHDEQCASLEGSR